MSEYERKPNTASALPAGVEAWFYANAHGMELYVQHKTGAISIVKITRRQLLAWSKHYAVPQAGEREV